MVHLEDKSGAFLVFLLALISSHSWHSFGSSLKSFLCLGYVACAWLVSATMVEERLQPPPVVTQGLWGVNCSCERPRTGSWGVEEGGHTLCTKQGTGVCPDSCVGTPPLTCVPELGSHLPVLWNSETTSDFIDEVLSTLFSPQ